MVCVTTRQHAPDWQRSQQGEYKSDGLKDHGSQQPLAPPLLRRHTQAAQKTAAFFCFPTTSGFHGNVDSCFQQSPNRLPSPNCSSKIDQPSPKWSTLLDQEKESEDMRTKRSFSTPSR